MAIKFPRMNIAESVVNRILNEADDLGIFDMPMSSAAPEPRPIPVTPDADEQGMALDQALAQPVPEMPPLADDPMDPTAQAMEGIMTGDTALHGLIDNGG